MDPAATSSGARFYRCALQVNPHDYPAKFRGQLSASDPAEHAEAIVGKAAALGVSVLAVTDHNSVSGVQAFRDVAAPYGIHVFPGFELTSSEGIHVLCIYPENTAEGILERRLGGFGIEQPGASSRPANSNFVEILTTVRKQGGIAVAAHATTDKNGLLAVLQGQALIKLWKHDDLLAIQIPGAVDNLPDKYRKIVQNRNAAYRRDRAAGDRLAVAAINAKDVVTAANLDEPGATCWIKMSAVSIEGLRQAFLDPDSRIRLNSDPLRPERAEMISLKWEGGFLDGVEIRFNPSLNVLVGGRGAGKSAIVESLRYVLGLSPVGAEARSVHKGMVESVLRSGTKVSLRVRSPRPSLREYLIERTVPDGQPLVLHGDGQFSDLTPQDILQHVEVYGQHEISDISRTPSSRANLLYRFSQNDESLDRRKTELLQNLEKSREDIVSTRAEIQRIDDLLATLPGLEEQIARYNEAEYEVRLRARRMLEREERILNSIPERMRPFRESLESLRQDLPADLSFVSDKALDELPGREILKDVAPILERLSADLKRAATTIEDSLQRADEGIGSVREQWGSHKREIEEAYARILRELNEQASDADRFIGLQREIENLRPLQGRREQLERLEKEQATRRRMLLREWENARMQKFSRLEKGAKDVNRQLDNRVRVQVMPDNDREPLVELLRDEIGGRLSEAIDGIRVADPFSLQDFAERCRRGADTIIEAFPGTPQRQADRLAAAPDDLLMRIEELDLLSYPSVELNTAPEGGPPSWRPIEKLSTGQKATAVLLLLLLDGDDPLIIDQPEDDLDNSFITNQVVPRMRDAKRRRQFVLSTHNANIPVLGDAELILGLTPESDASDTEEGRAKILQEHAGAIDSPGVRDLVERVLEGGRDAFERRRAKYGF